MLSLGLPTLGRSHPSNPPGSVSLSSEGVAGKGSNLNIIHTDQIVHTRTNSFAPEYEAQLVCVANGLKGTAGLGPLTRCGPRGCTSGGDAADCVLVWVLERETASIVLRLVESDIGYDAVILPRTRLHGLDKSFATPAAAVGARIERRCEGILATAVWRARLGKGIGGGTDETHDLPRVGARSGGGDAGFEAGIGNDVRGGASACLER